MSREVPTEDSSKLFDSFQKREDRWTNPGESHYSWLNRSSKREALSICRVLEQWFQRYPREWRARLKGSLKSKDPSQFYGGFFELFVHELFLRLGYSVAVTDYDAHPDFLASIEGRASFYVEATTLNVNRQQLKQGRIFEEIRCFLNERLFSCPVWLDMDISEATHAYPTLNRLVADVSCWLNAQLPRFDENSCCNIPALDWAEDNWRIRFEVVQKRPVGGKEVIGVCSDYTDGGWLTSVDDLIEKIGEKNKFKNLGLPFVLAINSVDFMRGIQRKTFEQALTGERIEEYVVSLVDASVNYRAFRETNGFFVGPEGVRHRTITAILGFSGLYPSSLGGMDYCLFIHPDSLYPFGSGEPLLSLGHAQIDTRTGKTRYTDGLRLEKLLAIPSNWPRN